MYLVMNTEIETSLLASHGGYFDCWLFMPECFDSGDTNYCSTLVYRTFDIVDHMFHLFHKNNLL